MSNWVVTQELLDKYPSLQAWKDGDRSQWKGGREQALLTYIKARPDFTTLQNNPSKVLAAIDEFANTTKFLMNISSHKGQIVTDLIAEKKPEVFVKLGGYVGYSAILFADQMGKVVEPGKTIRYWNLEYDDEFAGIASELIGIAGLGDVVTVVVGKAEDSLRELQTTGQVEDIDILFLDHVEALYVQDLKVCEELGLLKTGSCVVADNVVIPGAP